jgi:hypothetical protein
MTQQKLQPCMQRLRLLLLLLLLGLRLCLRTAAAASRCRTGTAAAGPDCRRYRPSLLPLTLLLLCWRLHRAPLLLLLLLSWRWKLLIKQRLPKGVC